MPQPTSARFLTPRLRPAHGAQVMPQHDMIPNIRLLELLEIRILSPMSSRHLIVHLCPKTPSRRWGVLWDRPVVVAGSSG
jgi:hypothetical protein